MEKDNFNMLYLKDKYFDSDETFNKIYDKIRILVNGYDEQSKSTCLSTSAKKEYIPKIKQLVLDCELLIENVEKNSS